MKMPPPPLDTAAFNRVFDRVSGVIAIPVRDEAERITDCLLALAQQGGERAGVLLLLNNTVDGTVAAVRDVQASCDMPIALVERWLPEVLSHAGEARRLAMVHADHMAPEGVPLLCTDADSKVAPGWLAANLRHLREGAEAVFGQAIIDPAEEGHIPPALQAADAVEVGYAGVLDEISHLVDPDPADPWPRHTEASGASIAVSRAAYRRSGGVPAVGLGEDRAFALALQRVDARVRHARDVRVMVSARLLGRAAGGMADTIRRRLVAPEVLLDEALEPAADHLARMRLRARLRGAFGRGRLAFEAGLVEAGLGAGEAAALAGQPFFGQAWMVVDAAMPRRRVRVDQAGQETAAAMAIRAGLLAGLVAA